MYGNMYIAIFCLFILLHRDRVLSCSSSSSKPAAAKFQAETNNGIWWPATDEVSNKKSNSVSSTNGHYDSRHHEEWQEKQDDVQSNRLPETSNETGVNGYIGSNNSDNNEEQPQITASREPHQPTFSYYQRSSGISEADGSSSPALIESSIIPTIPESRHQQQSSSDSSSSSRRLPKSTQGLGLVQFSNKSITCNDGTLAGYYIRKSTVRGSDDNLWIIFLEGGWYCFDQRSCLNRWHRLKHLMSSSGWPSIKHVGGILSSDPTENPYWWNANHIFVPYCSSDTWSGRLQKGDNGNPFSFMGALIIDEVIKDLVTVQGLRSDSSVILAGSSAGGTGVMINLDHVESLLTQEFGLAGKGNPRVRGIADSGWFIDKVPLYAQKVNCNDVILCPPEISLQKGMSLWNARLPGSCRDSYPDEPWTCFFGYRIYPTLRASLFVFQWLFDEAQMIINNVPTPALRKEEWDYVYKVGDELKKTLMNVTNVFVPSCLAHTVLTHRDWRRVEVNSVELTKALKCWESGGIIEESNFIPRRKSPQKYWEDGEHESSLQTGGHRRIFRHGKVYSSSTTTPSSSSSSNNSNFSLSNNYTPIIESNDSSRRNRRRHNRHRHKQSNGGGSNSPNHRQNRRRRKKQEKRQKLQQNERSRGNNTKTTKSQQQRHRRTEVLDENMMPIKVGSRVGQQTGRSPDPEGESTSRDQRHVHHHNKHEKKRKRNRRWYSVCDATGISRGDIRLIEKCSWPQCNRSCPKLLNPLTGEEVDFKDLLKSFGLDLATMAKALGIDLATLNSMDHHVLLQMLTQNA